MIEILTPESVLPALRATSKKQALQEMSAQAARLTGLDERTILGTLLDRERLGSTGVGRGVAIPHGRLAGLDRIHGVFARAERPVDFDAIDDQPVDLIFLLLAPEQASPDHLKWLARVSRALRNQALCDTLRGCDNALALYALLTRQEAMNAA